MIKSKNWEVYILQFILSGKYAETASKYAEMEQIYGNMRKWFKYAEICGIKAARSTSNYAKHANIQIFQLENHSKYISKICEYPVPAHYIFFSIFHLSFFFPFSFPFVILFIFFFFRDLSVKCVGGGGSLILNVEYLRNTYILL